MGWTGLFWTGSPRQIQCPVWVNMLKNHIHGITYLRLMKDLVLLSVWNLTSQLHFSFAGLSVWLTLKLEGGCQILCFAGYRLRNIEGILCLTRIKLFLFQIYIFASQAFEKFCFFRGHAKMISLKNQLLKPLPPLHCLSLTFPAPLPLSLTKKWKTISRQTIHECIFWVQYCVFLLHNTPYLTSTEQLNVKTYLICTSWHQLLVS